MNYITTGGLGDSWISFLKIYPRIPGMIFDLGCWLHVESNDEIAKACNDLYGNLGPHFRFECHPDYIQKYKSGMWEDYIPVSSGVDSFCPLKGKTDIGFIGSPFVIDELTASNESKVYDIALQVSAGAKNSRSWKFNPFILADLLRKEGLKVVLVGNDKRYFKEEDVDNFVCKVSLVETMQILKKSKIFIGLSGFLNYYACSAKVQNLHLTEGKDHEKRYYHQEWAPYSDIIEYPSMQEVRKAAFSKL